MAAKMQGTIKLTRSWTIGEHINGGGFGTVYAAKSDDGIDCVIKLVPKAYGADRELLFVDLGKARNVVPIIDSGDAGESWALVMPRAQHSLRDYLEDFDGQMIAPEALPILIDIATALSDLDGKVVHRDLKPENVLYLDGSWCLADFGISRYAEATTAHDTRKFALTAPYAGPERWREERADISTDVYSFGIMAFEIMFGVRPFPGPRNHELREQHLHMTPPDLPNSVPLALRGLIAECLYKAPGARPSPANILARLERMRSAPTPVGRKRLQEANHDEVKRQSEKARVESERRSFENFRLELQKAAAVSFKQIGDSLFSALTDAAPSMSISRHVSGGIVAKLNNAEFEIGMGDPQLTSVWANFKSKPFDVVATAALGVKIPTDRRGYEGRSHSLWYCDAQQEGRFGWFEVAFMMHPLLGRESKLAPFALPPAADAAKAFSPDMAEVQLAWPMTLLDTTDLEDFIDRWCDWFGAAAHGDLTYPRSLPERSTEGSWRKR